MKTSKIIYNDLKQLLQEKSILAVIIVTTLSVMLFASAIILVFYFYIMGDAKSNPESAKRFLLASESTNSRDDIADAVRFWEATYEEIGQVYVTGIDQNTSLSITGASDYNLHKDEVILWTDLKYDLGLTENDLFIIGNKTCKIAAFQDEIAEGSDVLCSLDTFWKSNADIEDIRIVSRNVLSEQKLHEINDVLTAKYSCTLFSDLDNYEDIFSTIVMLGIIACILCYCLFFEILLLKAWHNMNYKKYMMYRIMGCKESHLVKIILTEEIIVGTTGALLGSALYTCSGHWRMAMDLGEYRQILWITIPSYFIIWITGSYLQARKVSTLNLKEYNKWREI